MAYPTNPPSGNPGSGTQPSAADTVRDIVVEGNIEGNFIVGNNNRIYEGEVNIYHGDVLNFSGEPTVRRHDANPQPPRPPRGFGGRASELATLEQVIAEKDAAFIYGHDGLGKTDLVNQAANCDLARNMPDGVARIESVDGAGSALGSDDVIQGLFDTFFYSMPPLKVDAASAQPHLNNIAPLVILDGFDFPATAFDQFPNLIRNGALLATHQSLVTDEDIYLPVELTPLARQDAVQLLAGKSGLAVDASTEAVMDRICALCGDVPLAITKLAKTIQRKRLDLVDVKDRLANLSPPSGEPIQAAIERGFGVIYSQLSPAERQALLLVAAAPGISVDRAWLENATQDPYVVAELEMLELIQANSPRMRLAPGLCQILSTGQVNWQSQRNALLRYLVDELQSRPLDFDFIAKELGNILGLIEWAAGENRWNEVIALGRAVDPYLTLKRLWDAWAKVLQWVLLAGRSLADHATQAWALHQLGTREIGVGTIDRARDYLVRALRIRESLGDEVGAEFTRHNLKLILPPPGSTDNGGNGIPPSNPITEFIQEWLIPLWMRLRERYPRIVQWLIPALLALIAAILIWFYGRVPPIPSNLCPIPDDWIAYSVQVGDTIDSISQGVARAIKGETPVIKMAILEVNFCNRTEIEEPNLVPPGAILYVPAYPINPTPPPTTGPATPPAPGAEISLMLTRRPDDSSEVERAGQAINYVNDIANVGKEALTGRLSIEDGQGNEIVCSEFNTVGNLDDIFDPEEIITCNAQYRVTQADIDNGLVVIAATASIGNIESNKATLAIEVTPEFGLEIDKQAVPAIYHQAGQEITYTYTIRNSGNITISPVQLFVHDDHLNGEGTEFLCGPEVTTLAPGDTVDCEATYTITQADIEAGSVTNQARVSIRVAGFTLFGTTAPPVEILPATATVNYVLLPTLDKTANRKDFDDTNQEIRYTYTVTNGNKVPIPGPLTVTDALVSGQTRQELAVNCEQIEFLDPGATVSCTAMYLTTQADLDLGFIKNEATAIFGDLPPQQVSYTVEGIQIPELKLTNSANPTTYNRAGQAITYTYTIENTGNVTLGPAQFKVSDDRVDNGNPFNCGPDTAILARRETLSCSKTYIISPADLEARFVSNQAIASVIVKVKEFISESVIANDKEITSESVSVQVSCPYPPGSPWRIYTVFGGDTLSRISGWYNNTTATDLMQANCLPSTAIYAGQSLYVPGPPPLATIQGYILSELDGRPVQNVTVNLLNTRTNTIIASYTTGPDGFYRFTGLNAGEYRIYQQVFSVSDRPGEIYNRNFGIIPQ